jgi:hypothetical protein
MFYQSVPKANMLSKVNEKRAGWLPSECAMCYTKRVKWISNDRVTIFVSSLVLPPIYDAFRWNLEEANFIEFHLQYDLNGFFLSKVWCSKREQGK